MRHVLRSGLPAPEPAVRSYAVTHPAGTVVLPQAPGWDQLLFAAGGVMTVETPVGLWVVPPHRAVWVPAGVEHRLVMSGRVRLRSLYLATSLAALPPACRVVEVPPLLRELVLHAVRSAPLWSDVPAHARLVGVLVDQLVTVPDAPLQLPLPTTPVARAVADALLADPADGRDVGALARSAGASRRTVERAFARETGLPVGAWRQRLRLVAALRLLAAGTPTTQVALAVGYSTPSAFAAMFRKAMATTPTAFRRPPIDRAYDEPVRSADTTPDAYARQIEAYRAMPPERRVAVAAEMSEEMLVIAADGIRARHPDYDEAQVRWALLRLRHGDGTFRSAWPDAPLVSP